MAQKAIATYQKIMSLEPNSLAVANNLGNIYYTVGQPVPAIRSWEKAVQIDPGFLDGHLNLGKVYYVRGELKKSAHHFEEALRIDPNNSEAIVYLKRMVE